MNYEITGGCLARLLETDAFRMLSFRKFRVSNTNTEKGGRACL